MYLIFHPSYPGHIWAEVDEDGDTDNDILQDIITRMREGIYTEKGFNLRCVPDIRKKIGKKKKFLALVAKKSDCTTLGELFAPKKTRGNPVRLKTISEENRYKGKIDWESNRQQITNWIDAGLSLGQVARNLNISPSALSKANTRYGLYTPKERVA